VASLLLGLTGPGATAAPSTPGFAGVPVEALAKYVGQSTCSPTAKAGTAALRSLVLASYSGTGDSGIVRACTVGGTSEHKEGRAWDWRVNAFDATQDAAAKDLFAWLLATDAQGNEYALARRLGIMYMIYNRHTWSAYNAAAGWRPYTGSNPHTDHVHISLSWPGADKQVSFWGAGAPVAPTATAAVTAAITKAWELAGGAGGPLGVATGPVTAVRGGQSQAYRGGQVLWSATAGAHAVYGDIGERYRAVGGPDSPLGLPTTSEVAVRGGRGNTFQGGQVLWSLGTGAHAVYGAIAARYKAHGGPDGVLGLPTTSEAAVRGGRGNTFQGGQVLWSLATGAHAVYGAIGERYRAVGGPDSPLGLPTTSEIAVPGGRGGTFQGGEVLWSLGTGAHAVYGAIAVRYKALGGPAGGLGLPTTSERAVPGGRGNDFTGGQVLWSAGTGAHAVYGAIGERYRAVGGPASPLGLPTTGEVAVPGGRGVTFQGGQVLWSATTGAHAVSGPIGERYRAVGGPASPLGLPTTSEVAVPGGRGNSFQGGQVLWSTATGAHAVYGGIAARYQALGGPAGVLGLPTTSERDVPGGRGNDFQGGQVLWSPATGAHAVHGEVWRDYVTSGGPAGPLGLPRGGLEPTSGAALEQVFSGGRVYLRGALAHRVYGAILGRYLELGGPTGTLGLPTSDEYDVPGGRRNDFDGGQLTWSSTTGLVTGR